jgi:flagellar protein FliS
MTTLQHQSYAQSQVATSSPSELVVLLYRGAVRFAAKARLHIQNGRLEPAHQELIRAQQIVLQLMGALRPSERSADADLYALHNYIYEVLYRANRYKDVAAVDEALKHLRTQLDTWEQIALPPSSRPVQSGGVVSIDRRC